MNAPRKPMRDSMPHVAAFIDEMRAAFGEDEVNAQIRIGMDGAQTFYACENGIEVGTRMPSFEESPGITLNRMVILSKEEAAERAARRK